MPATSEFENSYEKKDPHENMFGYEDDISSFMAKSGDAAEQYGVNTGNLANAISNVKKKLKDVNVQSKTVAEEQAAKMAGATSKIRKIVNGVNTAKLVDNPNDNNPYTDDKVNDILEKARAWNQKRKDYYNGKFMNLYNQYDNLITTYLIMQRSERKAGHNIALEDEYKKKVYESVDEFNVDAAEVKRELIAARPDENTKVTDAEIVTRLRVVKKKSDGVSPVNGVIEENSHKYKVHSKITMKGKGEDGKLIRYKLQSDFTGKKAKRQYKNDKKEGHDKLRSDENKDDLEADTSANAGADTSLADINLLADAKGKNDASLYAAENSKMREGKDGSMGYYINGEFISAKADDKDAKIADESQANEEEELRTAIRNSAFFGHINSRTIQQYMTYDPDNAKQAVKDEMETLKDNAAPPAEKQGLQTAIQYLHAKYVGDAPPKDGDPNNAAITALDEKDKKTAIKYLLSLDNNKEAWALAKDIAVNQLGGTYAKRLEYVGNATGEIMRMSLWDEFENDGKRDKVPGYVSDIMAEEYKNMKGGTFLFSKNKFKALWSSGELTKHINSASGVFNAATDAAASGSELFDGKKNDDAENVNKWASFASEVTGFINETDALTSKQGAAGAVGAFALTGVAASGRDMDYADIMTGKGNALSSAAKIKGVYTIVKDIYKLYQLRKKRKDIKAKVAKNKAVDNDPKYKFLDEDEGGLGDSASKFIKICEDACTLISGVIEEFRLSKKEKDKWNGEEVFGTAKDILGIIRNIIDFNRSGKRIDISKSKMASTESSLNDLKSDELKAESDKNKQAQYMLTLTKSAAKRKIGNERFSRASNIFNIISNTAGTVNTVSSAKEGNWFNKLTTKAGLSPGTTKLIKGISGFVKKIASGVGKVVGVVQTLVDKRRRGNIQREVVGEALGNSKYYDSKRLSPVLLEETGIQSKHYIADLSRIFSSIDTHKMINNPDMSDANFKLSKKIVGNFYSNLSNDKATAMTQFKKVKFNDLLKESGFDGNWRVMLKNSITNKL